MDPFANGIRRRGRSGECGPGSKRGHPGEWNFFDKPGGKYFKRDRGYNRMNQLN
jgi:hypothetical protein